MEHDEILDAISKFKFYIRELPHHATPEAVDLLIEDLCFNIYQNRMDAERYRTLVNSGKYCPSSIGGLWGLRLSSYPSSKKTLDDAVDEWIRKNKGETA